MAPTPGRDLLVAMSRELTELSVSPNYALQRSWTHKLHGARTACKCVDESRKCAVTVRRAAAELRR